MVASFPLLAIAATLSSITKAATMSDSSEGSPTQAGSMSDSTADSPTRVRESGMPPAEYWETLVDAEAMLDSLGFTPGSHDKVVELGCGYGTITLPVAKRCQSIRTFDIEPQMVVQTEKRLRVAGLSNVDVQVRDVVADGYGLEDGSADAVLLMNILHCEEPVQMLRQAASLLADRGTVYASHWRYDESTPRGPPMSIRPRPEQLKQWAVETGLLEVAAGPVDCPPWHYGWTFRRIAQRVVRLRR
ncbi:hypothetical protein AK812_SmicGene3080 [Symbiodinium microadriaticum]|uniref:Methyltransferase domain-containing protein n=1 Tax=Symbiodinium microadriaticum TaxID=2951 RepID=A0A1Q9EZS4_SYMMI|nr:hypothetical protein AK812_SmicGene3080 [Symbiodinium microadriaticum]